MFNVFLILSRSATPDEVFSELLAEVVSLTVSRIVCQTFEAVPFMLKHLVSRQYHIGPEGAVIGSSPEASISLPQETALLDKHVEIKWISGILCKISGNTYGIIPSLMHYP